MLEHWRQLEMINKSELINLVILPWKHSYLQQGVTHFLFIDNIQANLTSSNNEVLLSQIDNSNSQKQPSADVFKIVVLEISLYSQKNICVGVSFYQKETPAHVFSCKYCKISKNRFFL